jgi:hypothetical protein
MVTNTPHDTAAAAAPHGPDSGGPDSGGPYSGGTDSGGTDGSAAADLLIDWGAVGLAERSCCCPSRPAFVAALPALPGRLYATELLLCGHHYRRSRAALAAAGATIVERSGLPVTPHQAWADE